MDSILWLMVSVECLMALRESDAASRATDLVKGDQAKTILFGNEKSAVVSNLAETMRPTSDV